MLYFSSLETVSRLKVKRPTTEVLTYLLGSEPIRRSSRRFSESIHIITEYKPCGYLWITQPTCPLKVSGNCDSLNYGSWDSLEQSDLNSGYVFCPFGFNISGPTVCVWVARLNSQWALKVHGSLSSSILTLH